MLSYDGSDFVGWQHQPGMRTVQDTVFRAVDRITPHHSRILGASRTDSGVHAEGQIASFASDRKLPPKGWLHELNALLPDDVAVRQAERCHPEYNPRFDAHAKLYRYRIRVGRTRDPLTRKQAWHVGPSLARKDIDPSERQERLEHWLDLDLMRMAGESLVGTHDFRAFRTSNDARENTERTLRAVRVVPHFGGMADQLALEVDGTAFLKHMVRVIAGTLVDVGRGRIAAERIPELLSPQAQRSEAGLTAPAHGLTLVHIELGREAANASTDK
jgi:tRNA pseudouridine38-40 synthase